MLGEPVKLPPWAPCDFLPSEAGCADICASHVTLDVIQLHRDQTFQLRALLLLKSDGYGSNNGMTELSEEAHRSAEQEISLRDLAALSAIWSLLLPRSYKRSGAKDNTVLVPSLNICVTLRFRLQKSSLIPGAPSG